MNLGNSSGPSFRHAVEIYYRSPATVSSYTPRDFCGIPNSAKDVGDLLAVADLLPCLAGFFSVCQSVDFVNILTPGCAGG